MMETTHLTRRGVLGVAAGVAAAAATSVTASPARATHGALGSTRDAVAAHDGRIATLE